VKSVHYPMKIPADIDRDEMRKAALDLRGLMLKIAVLRDRIEEDEGHSARRCEANEAWSHALRAAEHLERAAAGGAYSSRADRAVRRMAARLVPVRTTLLEEVRDTLSHAHLFIRTREQMHPTGQLLYEQLQDRISELLSTEPSPP
jgi:hypothetical protein